VRAGDVVSVYLDGATEKAAAVVRANAANIANLHLYQDRIVIRSADGGNVTNTNLGQWDNDNDADMMFYSNTASFTCRGVASSTGFCGDSGKKVVVVSGTTYAPAGDVVLDAMELSGTFFLSGTIVKFLASGTGSTCTAAAGTMRPFCINGGTFTPNVSVIEFDGSSATTIQSTTYDDVSIGTISDTGGGVTYTLGGDTTINGFQIGNDASTNSDTFNISSYTLTLTGGSGPGTPVYFLSTKGVYNGSSGLTRLNSSVGGNIPAANATYYDLELYSAGTVTYQIGTAASQTLTVNRHLTIGDGTHAATVSTTTYSPAVNVAGDLTINTNATLSGSGSGTITANGNVTGVGAVNLTGGTFELRVSAGKNFGTSSSSANYGFNNLTFSNSHASSPITITTQTGGSGYVTVTGVLTVGKSGDAAGATTTLDAGNRVWYLSGAGTSFVLTTSKGLLTANTSTFHYSGGASAQNLTAATYYDLTAQGNISGGTFTFLAGTFTVNNDLSIGNAIWAVTATAATNSSTISIGRDFLINSNTTYTANASNPLTISRNFTNNGTFTHSSGTVVFNDNTKTSILSYNAATTFNNFTVTTAGKALQFDNVDQTNIAGTLTLTGSDCSTGRIFLDSDVNNSIWEINATGTISVSYVDVEDANAIAAITANNSTADNGNNTNWTINAGSCGAGNTTDGKFFALFD
jgi:hypothetical protein